MLFITYLCIIIIVYIEYNTSMSQSGVVFICGLTFFGLYKPNAQANLKKEEEGTWREFFFIGWVDLKTPKGTNRPPFGW